MRARLRQRLAALRPHLRPIAPVETNTSSGISPRISVIVPIHGTDAYVERCLRSLMVQSMDEIEIVCVDDASPDRSASIVRRLARKDRRIRLIKHEHNRGLGGARNTGIAAARGIYVTGVDSDDFVRPTMMECLWQASGDGSVDVVACGMAVLNAEEQEKFNVSQPEEVINNDTKENDFLNLLNPSFCNKAWKRTLFLDHGISFPENQYFEDLATTPRLLYLANQIKIIADPLYCYVQREGSITNSTSPKHILDHFKAFDILAQFMEEKNLISRHHDSFLSLISKSLHYHTLTGGGTASPSNQPTADSAYFRYMLLLKLAYLEHNSTLLRLETSRLRDLMLEARSAADLFEPPTVR